MTNGFGSAMKIGSTAGTGSNVKDYLKRLGLDPALLDKFPIDVYEDEEFNRIEPNAAAVFDPATKRIMSAKTYADQPPIILHELFHGIEDSFRETPDQDILENLMKLNPPEGRLNTGFTNYPGGAPTTHHPVDSGWGLAAYIDYNHPKSTEVPYAEQFRNITGDKPWQKMPEPILEFLKKKFPDPNPDGIPTMQKSQNYWDLR